jgi:hypothetical protein
VSQANPLITNAVILDQLYFVMHPLYILIMYAFIALAASMGLVSNVPVQVAAASKRTYSVKQPVFHQLAAFFPSRHNQAKQTRIW